MPTMTFAATGPQWRTLVGERHPFDAARAALRPAVGDDLEETTMPGADA